MWKVSMPGLDTEQFVPLSQMAMLLTCEEWCNIFGNVTTTTMTRLLKCNFNFKTSIGHHLSSFCLQSLIGPERDEGHIYDSLVIVQKYTVSGLGCFYAHIHYPECFHPPTNVKFIFQGQKYHIYSCPVSFLLFGTSLDHKYVFLVIDISDFQHLILIWLWWRWWISYWVWRDTFWSTMNKQTNLQPTDEQGIFQMVGSSFFSFCNFIKTVVKLLNWLMWADASIIPANCLSEDWSGADSTKEGWRNNISMQPQLSLFLIYDELYLSRTTERISHHLNLIFLLLKWCRLDKGGLT